MADALATPDDVAAMWRSLAAGEVTQATDLCARASALLRQRLPTVDARIALFATDPVDRAALDPVVVADVVATMVKRVMVNTEGAVNRSVGGDGYTKTTTFVGARFAQPDISLGELTITPGDLKKLTPQGTTGVPSSHTIKPALAPCASSTPFLDGVFVADGELEPGVIYGPYL